MNTSIFTHFFKNVLNTNHVSRIRLKVFSLLMVIIATACNIVAQLPIPTSTPARVIPVTGPTPQATVDSTSTAAPEGVDLSKVTPKPFDAQMQAELDAYIDTVMQREQVPGAAVAVVQDGQVVYQQGFGVRELGKPDPVTPETLMMIGSTGKSMTTMMMATVVDDGKMTWDTPAVSILPTFAVSDPSLTSQITMRHLVCNCTGVERRDIEMYFPSSPRTAEGMIEGLRTFSFAGTFGESFQYSNQMVAAGGYLAARAASPTPTNLYDDFVAQMQQRVFDPIGMTSSTFSFDTAQANPNHATPHGRTADRQLVPISLQLEQPLQPVAPAGSPWSNVQDLAHYLITQLSQGVAPDGTRVVSADNIKLTWQPQVESAPNQWYALGWGVADYKGAHLLNHNGGTSGFTSNLTFLPDANLGIAILSNAQDNNIFIAALLTRMLELAYGLPMEADAGLAQRSAEAQQALRDQLAQLPPHLDRDAAVPYQGVYTNPSLGEAKLALQGEKLVLDAGMFTTELRSAGNGTYLIWEPPLVGLLVKLAQDVEGQPTWQLISEDPTQPGTYSFTQKQPTAMPPGSGLQRIKFATGATSAAVSGDLPAKSTARYVLRAQAGQLMEVDLSVPEGASLSVTTADGLALAPITGSSTSFRGYLPRNGDYILTVASSRQPISYFVDISIPQRVAFARGATSITVEGLVNTQQSLDYVLRAQAGQSMEISITPENSVQLIIYGVDGTVLRSGMGEGSSFRGELPISEDYVVMVRAGDEEVSFTMNVIIPEQ